MTKQKISIIPLAFFLFACQQESFILLRNLDRAQWFSLQDFLTESGLASAETTPITNQISRPPSPPPSSTSTPQESRYMTIPPNKEFIVQLSGENVLISLKSVSGVAYLKDVSDPAQGLFAFQSITNSGRAIFQYYDLDGRLIKNLTYYFQIQKTEDKTTQTNIVTRRPQVSFEETNVQTNIPSKSTTPNIDWFISSLKPLPTNEAIKNLESSLQDNSFSDTEKELLSYTLIEYYLKQRLYSRASNRIESIQNTGYKAYYQGLYYESLLRFPKALEQLVRAIDSGGDVLPHAIIAAGRVMINGGIADATLTKRLDTLIPSIKDPNLFAESMIYLAQLYERLRDIKRAKEIYQTILKGTYPARWKQEAQKNLSLLEQEFR